MKLLVSLVAALRRHDLVGESAKIAFFMMLSLFPLVLVLLALTGFIGGEAAFASIVATLQLALPTDAAANLEEFLMEVARDERPGLFSAGLVIALWAASIALFRLADGLARMHGIERRGSWIGRRLRALGVLLMAAVVFIVGLVILLIEPYGPLEALAPVWTVLRWPLSLLLLSVVLGLVFYFLPRRKGRASVRAGIAGGILGAGLWILATGGLRLYVYNFGELGPAYAPIGTVVVALGWIFATAASILIGAQLVAILEARRFAARHDPGAAPHRTLAPDGGDPFSP